MIDINMVEILFYEIKFIDINIFEITHLEFKHVEVHIPNQTFRKQFCDIVWEPCAITISRIS
jgi:uncharacterized ubiquitin-like protein YukD